MLLAQRLSRLAAQRAVSSHSIQVNSFTLSAFAVLHRRRPSRSSQPLCTFAALSFAAHLSGNRVATLDCYLVPSCPVLSVQTKADCCAVLSLRDSVPSEPSTQVRAHARCTEGCNTHRFNAHELEWRCNLCGLLSTLSLSPSFFLALSPVRHGSCNSDGLGPTSGP
jgi:hypothetical protein